MVWHGMPYQSTTEPPRQWKRRLMGRDWNVREKTLGVVIN